MINLPAESVMCPYTGHKKSCRSLALNCPKFIQIQGENPNTGQSVNEYGCADAWLPLIMMDVVRVSGRTSAAIESFRNEMVTLNAIGPQRIVDAEQAALLENRQ